MENTIPNNPTPNPAPNPMPSHDIPHEENTASVGPIIGTIIIIALIILGGLYFWGKRIEENREQQSLTAETVDQKMPEQNEAAVIRSISSSDSISDIEADLQATNLNNLDAEVKAAQ